MIFIKDFETGLKDVGKNSEITNKAILEIFEDIAAKHGDDVGDGLNDIFRLDTVWIILDWKVKVIKRPKYGQNLNVLTWGRAIKKCYIYRDFEMYDNDNNLCAIATSKWVCVDMVTRKIVSLKEDRIEKYEPEYGIEVFKGEKLEKVTIPNSFESSFEYVVKRRDIDVNNHMHNLYYLDFAYEALPENVYKNREFADIRIMYKKEIKLGDRIVCKYSKDGDKHVVVIESENGDVVHSVIELISHEL